MHFLGQCRSGVPIGYHLDVSTAVTGFRLHYNVIELTACGHARCEPSIAAERLRQLVILPRSEIVVIGFRVLSQQTFDQIPVVIQHEDDWPQAKAMELADFLRG